MKIQYLNNVNMLLKHVNYICEQYCIAVWEIPNEIGKKGPIIDFKVKNFDKLKQF